MVSNVQRSQGFLLFLREPSIEAKFIEPTKQVPKAVPTRLDEQRSPVARTPLRGRHSRSLRRTYDCKGIRFSQRYTRFREIPRPANDRMIILC